VIKRRSYLLRLVLGLAVGIVLLAVVIAQVDLGAVAQALAGASLPIVVLAVGVVLVDLGIRALRWRILLAGAGSEEPPRLRLALAYLNFGYVANLILPARLGDLARAYLSGSAFRISRLSALGTIVVERVSDGATMLVLAIGSSLVVAGVAAVQTLALWGAALAGLGLLVLACGWLLLTRSRLYRTRLGGLLHSFALRVATGMAVLRSPAGAASVALATLAAAGTATIVAWLAAGAVGVSLTPAQAVLFLSGIALSLAIPAAPASFGTFELVGVVILTSLGNAADTAFATVLLLRAITLIPPVILGLLAIWVLHLRPSAILEAAGATEAAGAPDAAESRP
jgi:glycosyltransferase 2 family protein